MEVGWCRRCRLQQGNGGSMLGRCSCRAHLRIHIPECSPSCPSFTAFCSHAICCFKSRTLTAILALAPAVTRAQDCTLPPYHPAIRRTRWRPLGEVASSSQASTRSPSFSSPWRSVEGSSTHASTHSLRGYGNDVCPEWEVIRRRGSERCAGCEARPQTASDELGAP